jgi:tRNA pseudouridine13 synthase
MELKRIPEDFVVREKSTAVVKGAGEYVYFLLRKRGYNTLDAVEAVANALHVPAGWIGFAGNKDKQAVTEQVCSINNVSAERLKEVLINDIEIIVLGRGEKPISLGDLDGNYFEITIRDAPAPEKRARFVNYFGEQRFGENNADVGKAIVKKDFKQAAYLLGFNPLNPVSELVRLNKKLLGIYVNAFQSKIWNESVRKIIELGISADDVPVVGFGTEFIIPEVEKVVSGILAVEGVSLRDFIIKQIPELSAEGAVRKVYCEAQDLAVEKKDNDVLLKFFLPKGCYATVFVEQLFKAE